MPRAELPDQSDIDIGVVGIGSATPYPVGSYCHDAPSAIRAARSWPTILEQHDFDLFGAMPSHGVLPPGVAAADFGDIDVAADAAPEITDANRRLIREVITAMLDAGTRPIRSWR